MNRKLYSVIAQALARGANDHYRNQILDAIEEGNFLPSGSGFDNGCTIDRAEDESKITIAFSYHHLNADGYYTHWSSHKAVITPSLIVAFDIQITDLPGLRIEHRDDEDYYYDTFFQALDQEVDMVFNKETGFTVKAVENGR